jgi:hypothetical protein
MPVLLVFLRLLNTAANWSGCHAMGEETSAKEFLFQARVH